MAGFVELIGIARDHNAAEAAGDFDAVMSTMAPDPVFEFYPAGVYFRGRERTERFFRNVMRETRACVRGYRLEAEFVGPAGIVQEYDIDLALPGQPAAITHRIIAVLPFGDGGLAGERMYGDSAVLQFFAGDLWSELRPTSELARG